MNTKPFHLPLLLVMVLATLPVACSPEPKNATPAARPVSADVRGEPIKPLAPAATARAADDVAKKSAKKDRSVGMSRTTWR